MKVKDLISLLEEFEDDDIVMVDNKLRDEIMPVHNVQRKYESLDKSYIYIN